MAESASKFVPALAQTFGILENLQEHGVVFVRLLKFLRQLGILCLQLRTLLLSMWRILRTALVQLLQQVDVVLRVPLSLGLHLLLSTLGARGQFRRLLLEEQLADLLAQVFVLSSHFFAGKF